MKKIFLTALLAGIAAFFVPAAATNTYQKKNAEMRKLLRKEIRERRDLVRMYSVNATTEAKFYIDFPDAKKVTWRQEAFAEASFFDSGIYKTAFYDRDNELVGTTEAVDYSLVPEKARKFIDKNYPDYRVKQALLFDDNEINETDMNLFSRSFNDEDNYFTLLSNGKKEVILKVSMDGDVSFFKERKAASGW